MTVSDSVKPWSPAKKKWSLCSSNKDAKYSSWSNKIWNITLILKLIWSAMLSAVLFVFVSGALFCSSKIFFVYSVYSTVDLDCDLEKISRKRKFGIDVSYTFRIPTQNTLGTTKIHNDGFTTIFLHFNLKNCKNIISYLILCVSIRFCFEYLLLSFKCQ